MNETFTTNGGKFFFLLILLVFIGCSSGENSSDGTASAKESHFTSNEKKISTLEFDNKMNQMMEAEGIPGTSIAIIENGKIAYSSNYGIKNLNTGEEVDDETVFEAASLSKPYFVYVVYKLVEEGRLDLDKPMYQYLENPSLEHDPRYKVITPRMILGHNSGLENWANYNHPDVLEIISEPGSKFVYSGEGYNYLSEVVAGILGESYDEYMARLVIEPMGLSRTFTRYKTREPINYAVGHSGLGGMVEKWKNDKGIASSGIHHTAKDYGTFIANLFDRKHLSNASVTDMLKPVTEMEEYRSWGGGVEVHYFPEDTLIAHGGHNEGSTSFLFYSVVNQRGFVLATNSERGLALLKPINEMTAELPIADFFDQFYIDQYPSEVPKILQIYKEKGAIALKAAIEERGEGGTEILGETALNELGEILSHENSELARIPLEYCLQKYPKSSYGKFVLGNVCNLQKDFETSIRLFTEAQNEEYFFSPLEMAIVMAKEGLANAQQTEKITVPVISDKFKLEGELYSEMKGIISLFLTEDESAGRTASYLNGGNWIDYKINISNAGKYSLKFHTASDNWEDAKIRILSGETLVGELEIPVTKGWGVQLSTACEVTLPKGEQTLRIEIVKGYFDLDWIGFSRAKDA